MTPARWWTGLGVLAGLSLASGVAGQNCDEVVFDPVVHFSEGTVANSPACVTGPRISGGEKIDTCIFEHPPHALPGATTTIATVRWTGIALPALTADEGLFFISQVGIEDGLATSPSVVLMQATVGRLTATAYVDQKVWRPMILDVTALAGSTVGLELLVDSLGNSYYDWAAWGAPLIVKAKHRAGFGYPENGHQVIGPGGVNTLSGNLIFTVQDLTLPAGGLTLTFNRTYNSQRATPITSFGEENPVTGSPFVSALGPGWTHDHQLAVRSQVDLVSGSTLYVEERGDGREPVYTRSLSGEILNQPGITDQLTVNAPGQGVAIRRKTGLLRTYDAAGNLARISDPNGSRLTYSYTTTAQGVRLTGVVAQTSTALATAPGSATVGFVVAEVSLAYDPAGRLVTMTSPDPSGTGTVSTTYAYDLSGRLTGVTGPGNIYHATYEYDFNGRITRKSDPRAPPGEKVLRFQYDSLGRVFWVSTDGFKGVAQYLYFTGTGEEPETHLVQPAAFGDRITKYRYDRCKVVSAEQLSPAVVTDFHWDPQLNRDGLVDPNGGVASLAYDHRGNPTAWTDAAGQQALADYDAAYSRPTRVVNERGAITVY